MNHRSSAPNTPRSAHDVDPPPRRSSPSSVARARAHPQAEIRTRVGGRRLHRRAPDHRSRRNAADEPWQPPLASTLPASPPPPADFSAPPLNSRPPRARPPRGVGDAERHRRADAPTSPADGDRGGAERWAGQRWAGHEHRPLHHPFRLSPSRGGGWGEVRAAVFRQRGGEGAPRRITPRSRTEHTPRRAEENFGLSCAGGCGGWRRAGGGCGWVGAGYCSRGPDSLLRSMNRGGGFRGIMTAVTAFLGELPCRGPARRGGPGTVSLAEHPRSGARSRSRCCGPS